KNPQCSKVMRPALMVTGGCDRSVRLWTRFVTTHPVATLLGHRATILDVAIYQPVGQILSYSRDAVRGGGGLTAEIQYGQALSCALYNPTLRQVVTGHVNSSVSLWDVETGRRRLQILNAHGEDELICLELDSSHKRLITGARNGTIKVWNLLNGLNLHKLEPVTNSEVTSLTCLHDNKLLAVGWSQRIIQYDIAADLYVRADMSWKSSGVHKADILAVCQCPALGAVATASHDGEVIIWSLSSDQSENTFLVSGDTTGWLQIWDISHYALDIQHKVSQCQEKNNNNKKKNKNCALCAPMYFSNSLSTQSVCEGPTLLQCWKAHQAGLVSVEVLEAADRLFILTASADTSAALWTKDGDRVGTFGQEVVWNIADAAAYQRWVLLVCIKLQEQ
uniref:Uncharacterized protein n=1 Tax=Echeneis naucrates TaxID=173247 RepID=A0A665W864_ECHNA